MKALENMKSQGAEGLASLLAGQQEVLLAIAREKAELRPYLDQWERLEPAERAKMRQGRAGAILDALEAVAQGIAARHQDWFGDDGRSAPGAGSAGASGDAAPGRPADAKGAEGARGAGAGEAGKEGAGKSVEQPGQDLSQTINLYRGLK